MGNVIVNSITRTPVDQGGGVWGGLGAGTAPPASTMTRIVSPEYTFTDDFEGTKDASFWAAGTSTTYGDSSADPANTGAVLAINYSAALAGSDSFAEQRFVFPDSVQVEMSYRVFVPANFTHRAESPGNNKLFALWSGSYGTAASNVSIVSEYNRATVNPAGGYPDLLFGEDGNNYGHSGIFDQSGDRVFLESEGAWHDFGVYIELAGQEGEYGTAEIWRDGTLILSNQWPLDIAYAAGGVPSSQQLAYSTRGNFLNRGYLMGWANSGFLDATSFEIDNFSLKTRTSSIGATY